MSVPQCYALTVKDCSWPRALKFSREAMGASAAAAPPASLGARPMLAFLNSLSGLVHLVASSMSRVIALQAGGSGLSPSNSHAPTPEQHIRMCHAGFKP